jgi:hypothetical protein
MTLAAKCLLEIQTVFPTADARVNKDMAEIFVPVPNRAAAPIVLGSGRDFDVAGVRAVAYLGDTNPEFAKRSIVYAEWAV